ncbi:MAG: hypothetical protein ABI559_05455 [Chloroflexota bacterium]
MKLSAHANANLSILGGLILAASIAAASALLLRPSPSRAAFPGQNGDIVFDSDRTGAEQIYRIPNNGGTAIPLTDAGRNYSAVWSPDGTRIAFVSERDGNAEVYVMNADGSGETRRTTNDGQDSGPAWSADGQKIVFLRRTEPTDIELWIVNASGGANPQMLIGSSGVDTMPSFSPDGTKIAYGHNDPGENDTDIFVADADGSNPMRITDNDTPDYNPNWSPDSSQIVYMCDPGDANREICVVDAGGGTPQQLTNNAPISDEDAAFSPDGTRIVFYSDRPDTDTFGIYTMDTSGGDLQPVTTDNAYEPDWGVATGATASPTKTPLPTTTLGPGLLQGDVNCDHAINTDDVVLILEYAAELNNGTTPGECPDIGGAVPAGGFTNVWGDVTCDSQVDAVDALHVIAWPDIEIPHPDCRDIGQAIN